MPKYFVTGYYVQPWTVEVEADNEEDARDIGIEMLGEGEGSEGDGSWQDEYDSWEAE